MIRVRTGGSAAAARVTAGLCPVQNGQGLPRWRPQGSQNAAGAKREAGKAMLSD